MNAHRPASEAISANEVKGLKELSFRVLWEDFEMKGNALVALVAAATFLVLPDRAPAQEVTVRAECQKRDDRGCTAHQSVTIRAPEGMFIFPESLSSGEVINTNNRGSHRPLCGPARPSGTVPYRIPGTDLISHFFISAEATLHVESGSGFRDLNQTFFVNCRYSFRTGRIPG